MKFVSDNLCNKPPVMVVYIMANDSSIKLLSKRFYTADYIGECGGCRAVYTFTTSLNAGSADFVDVICETCNICIGRVREDVGGTIYLTQKNKQCFQEKMNGKVLSYAV